MYLFQISKDGKWPTNVLDFIHKCIVDKTCTVTIENYPAHDALPSISLVIEPDLDLRKLLLDAKCAMEKEENDIVEDISYEETEVNILFASRSFPLSTIRF